MMEGKLTEEDMDQLEQWIGAGSKIFTLLYAITRDGCNSTAFHQKCDNQGPTVRVLYNQQGSVYGGYTSVSWQKQGGTYIKDDKAFIYQLKYDGSERQNKFHVKSQAHAVLHNSNYGPTFGSGHDLYPFSGVINKSGNVFPLNGYIRGFGNSYNNNGVTTGQINNDTMEVTELEVYKVSDGQRRKALLKENAPWRKTKEWNEKVW